MKVGLEAIPEAGNGQVFREGGESRRGRRVDVGRRPEAESRIWRVGETRQQQPRSLKSRPISVNVTHMCALPISEPCLSRRSCVSGVKRRGQDSSGWLVGKGLVSNSSRRWIDRLDEEAAMRVQCIARVQL